MPKPVFAKPTKEEELKKFRSDRLEYKRRKTTEKQDIGPIPDVTDPERRERCRENFGHFCMAYFPNTFQLDFSHTHMVVIEKIERTVLRGDLFAVAMPRGSGKTSMAEVAAIWALLYGHRSFVLMISATQDLALQLLESVKTELESNDLLLADFPECCFPIGALEGEPRRCRGQTYTTEDGLPGVRTQIHWMSDRLILPSVLGSPSYGSILRTIGIDGSFRGMKHKRPDGTSIRPSLVIIDDPQSDISAGSPAQCYKHERILAGAVLGLAGPNKKISGIMPMTVIRRDDLADRILDVEKHPEWNGSRYKMILSFPKRLDIWEGEYRSTLVTYDPNNPKDKGRAQEAATAMYVAKRVEMDEGCEVYWPGKKYDDEVSDIQHAMNLYLRDKRAFFAEYQNEPIPEVLPGQDALTPDMIMEKLNGIPVGVCPLYVSHLTGFIDVQDTLLYWVVCGWGQDFTGAVVDYGSYPGQSMQYFSLEEANPTLANFKANNGGYIQGIEAQLYAGLTILTREMVSQVWKKEDGTTLALEKILIDSSQGQKMDLLYQFCRESTLKGVVQPSHGVGIGASKRPITARRKQDGETIGLNWYIPATSSRAFRPVRYDTNFWKSFVKSRLEIGLGASGCLSLYGTDPKRHRMIADHCTSEFPVRVRTDERTVDEWQMIPHRDNHLWDCLVGCAVGASVMGCALDGMPSTPERKAPKERKRVSFAEMYRKAHQGGG